MSNQLRLLFFIVVISGALCTVEDYVIMSQCAHNKAIHLAAEGTVSVTDISKTQNITIVGLPDYINNDFKITLYAKETQRYLCFNENWKLVGMRDLQETCYFNETIVHGYFVFRSVIDLQRRVGFTHRGKAIGPKKNVTDACYLFTKIHAEQFFHQHTQFLAPPKPRASAASPPASTTAASKAKSPRNKTHGGGGGGGNRPHGGGRNGPNRPHAHGPGASEGSAGGVSGPPQLANASHPQHHQVRHHHNDPSAVARRHQHEHKQKRRQRNRTRATASPALAPATPTKSPATTRLLHPAATVAATQTAFRTTAATTKLVQKIAPTPLASSRRSALATPSRTAAATHATAATTQRATVGAASKRKGRRRKGDKQHKKHQPRLLQQQRQQPEAPAGPTPNAKDPQHRQAEAARARATAATFLPSSSTPGDDDVGESSSQYSSLSPEWSSIEPSTPTADRFEFPGPSATTLGAASSSLDVAASSMWPTADTTLPTMESNALFASDVAATATATFGHGQAQTATPGDRLDPGGSLYSSPADARPTAAFDAARAWSEATTTYDDSETSVGGEQLLVPTPMLATPESATALLETNLIAEAEPTASTEEESSSSDAYETTGGLFDTEATAETTTADDETTTWSGDGDGDEAGESSVATEEYASPTATSADVAATSAAGWPGTAATTFATATTGAEESSSSSSSTGSDYSMTEYVFSTRSSNIHNKSRRHRNQSHRNHQSNSGNSPRDRVAAHANKSKGVLNSKASRSKGHAKTTTKAAGAFPPPTSATSAAAASDNPLELLFGHRRKPHGPSDNGSNTWERRAGLHKNIGNNQHNNTLFDYAGGHSGDSIGTSFPMEDITATPTAATSTAAAAAATTTTTRRHFRKSTQKLLATPFHQLTYVRNNAGDIDIDNIDNISVYPDLDEDVGLEADGNGDSDGQSQSQSQGQGGGIANSRMTIVSGYLPTSATATLPESIRIAKIKINNERKRMLRQRSVFVGSTA